MGGLVLALAVSAVAAAPAAAAPGTCVAGTGAARTLTVTVRLEFHSRDLSKDAVTRWANLIESSVERQYQWAHLPTGGDVEVDVQTRVRTPGAPATRGYDQIELHPDPDWRDSTELGRPNSGKAASGDWSASRAAGGSGVTLGERERGWAHEVGHLAGLGDQYDTYISDASGREVKVDNDFGTSGDLADAIRKLAEQNGLDPNTAKGASRPRPGHEGDIMGNSKRNPNATLLPADAAKLLAGAGRCREQPKPAKCVRHGVPIDYSVAMLPIDRFLFDPGTALAEYLTPFLVRVQPTFADEEPQLRAMAERIDPLIDAYVSAREQSDAAAKANAITQDVIDRELQAGANLAAVTGEMGGREAKAHALARFNCPGYTNRNGATTARVAALRKRVKRQYERAMAAPNDAR